MTEILGLLQYTLLRGKKLEKFCSDFGIGGFSFTTADVNVLRDLDETDLSPVLV